MLFGSNLRKQNIIIIIITITSTIIIMKIYRTALQKWCLATYSFRLDV